MQRRVKFVGSLKRPKNIQVIPKTAIQKYAGELFKIFEWQQKDYFGNKSIFEKAVLNDSVYFIPVTTNGELIIAEQKQPARKKFLGILGGRCENNESVKSALLRELLEETQIIPGKVKVLGVSKPFVKIDWYQYYFLIFDFEDPKGYIKNEGEKIKLIHVTAEDFYNLVTNDTINDLYLKSTLLKCYLEGGINKVTSFLLNPD